MMEISSRVEAGQLSKGREIFPLGVCETFIYGGTLQATLETDLHVYLPKMGSKG